MKPGNRVEEKTLTIRERANNRKIRIENPPFMTVNTQLILKFLYLWSDLNEPI